MQCELVDAGDKLLVGNWLDVPWPVRPRNSSRRDGFSRSYFLAVNVGYRCRVSNVREVVLVQPIGRGQPQFTHGVVRPRLHLHCIANCGPTSGHGFGHILQSALMQAVSHLVEVRRNYEVRNRATEVPEELIRGVA